MILTFNKTALVAAVVSTFCALASLQPGFARSFPTCVSAATDPDGDGFGFENNQSCVVEGSGAAVVMDAFPTCASAATDPDGDGFGFENNQSCVVSGAVVDSGSVTGGFPTCASAATDPDGDGFGFENNQSCVVEGSSAGGISSSFPTCASADTDPDGDGFGFENGQSCLVDGGSAATGEFAFSTAAFSDYARVDRAGMPAIATALIASDDAYNAADPVNDAAGDFVPEIIASLTFLHGALDDQLVGLGLTPCTVVGDGTGTCVAAAGPLIIPDTLTVDTTAAAGFPNGRLLTDPVIGVTLAVALLELTGDTGQTPVSLVGALNPPANDVAFNDDFPFLADPQ